jgi:XTP/dITP diphosphohydrolase
MATLVIATRNVHKVQEIRDILGAKFECFDLSRFSGAPEVVEDAGTFAGNATKKAVELAKWLSVQDTPEASRNTFVLADDSGLEVDTVGGAPGVHSARFAAMDKGQQGNSSAAENNAKLLRLLKDVPREKRAGRFRCVLALTPILKAGQEGASPTCYADEFETATQLFEGTCEGRIILEEKGQGGFGYDPLFVPEGYELTFAELGEEIKNGLSHRARALERLRSWFEAVRR